MSHMLDLVLNCTWSSEMTGSTEQLWKQLTQVLGFGWERKKGIYIRAWCRYHRHDIWAAIHRMRRDGHSVLWIFRTPIRGQSHAEDTARRQEFKKQQLNTRTGEVWWPRTRGTWCNFQLGFPAPSTGEEVITKRQDLSIFNPWVIIDIFKARWNIREKH